MLDTIITALWFLPLIVFVYGLIEARCARRRADLISKDVDRQIDQSKQMVNGEPRPTRVWKE